MRNKTGLPQPLLDAYEWQERGACRDQPSSMFFDADSMRGTPRAASEEAAKRVCRRCPVIRECLAHALAAENFGVWGGLTARQRELYPSTRLGDQAS